MSDLIHVRINSPQKIIWEGDAEWVSSENSQGPFDILPMHANFVSIIENKDIKVKTANGVETYTFPRSVIYAHSNQVKIFTNL
jgi:F0F1-type ATP synthase epsilon subunit